MSEELANEVEIDLGILSDEDLVEFEAVLVADYEEKRGVQELGVEELSEIKALAETIKAVRAEMDTRVELSETDDSVAQVQGDSFMAKIQARKDAAAKAEADAAAAAEATAAAEAEAAAKAEADAKAAADAADAAKAGDTKIVEPVASGPTIVITPKDIDGDKKAETEPKATGIVAAAGSRKYAPNAELPDFAAVAETFIERRPEVRGTDKHSDGARFLVASVRGSYDDARTLGDDTASNMEKINAVTSPEALVASGGLCAPLTAYYPLTVYGDAHRPVRDSLPVFKADRGGIRFMPAPRITDLVGSVRRTTAAQDAAGYTNQDPAGLLDHHVVPCPSPPVG